MADAGLLLPMLGGVAYLGPFAAMIAAERALGLEPDAVRRLGALAVAVTEDAQAAVAAAAAVQRGNQAAGFDGPSLVAARRHGRGHRASGGCIGSARTRYRDRLMLAWARAGGRRRSARVAASLIDLAAALAARRSFR